MDLIALSLLIGGALYAVLHIGFRALVVHALDLRAHHPERYGGMWRALGDLVPSGRIESLRATVLGTLAGLAIVVLLAVSGVIGELVRNPASLFVALVGLAILTLVGSFGAFVVMARRDRPEARG